ncbi:TlpA family protein disulfide reductase [Algibacter sp.]|uniref:TlpA family protein disulfide reductase n=1 Tax=Algibacter sp. TaxID=1872428 RepID=UPI003C7700C6
MKHLLLVILLGLFSFSYSQPLKVSDIVSENKITSFSEQKLILVDFWATWCAPCIYATQQLEILQHHNKDKIFMISISDEPVAKLKSYIEKRPIELMVTSDYENFTFDKYNVQLRPYAVLLDLKGNMLWKGSPSDLSQSKLDQFYYSQKNVKSLKKLDKILSVKEEVPVSTKLLVGNKDFMISELNTEVNELIKNEDEVFYSGSLSNLVFTLKSTGPFEIKFDEGLDKNIKLVCTKDMWDNEKDIILDEVFDFFKLKREVRKENIEGVELIVKNKRMLWDSNQLNWEGSPTNYMVGIDRIQADNINIKAICSLLSREKNINYLYLGNDNRLYDWDFHFEFENLMKEELESSFGIYFKPIYLSTSITYISKAN